ncbi:MAG: hypothetical protein ACLP9L_00160 [Thermoguttaceae bacterium]
MWAYLHPRSGRGGARGLAASSVAFHRRFHIIIQTCYRNTAQMCTGAHVLAQRGRQILGLDESQLHAAPVAQDGAEQRDAAAALGGEVDVVDGVIHLGLGTPRRRAADHAEPSQSRRKHGTTDCRS